MSQGDSWYLQYFQNLPHYKELNEWVDAISKEVLIIHFGVLIPVNFNEGMPGMLKVYRSDLCSFISKFFSCVFLSYSFSFLKDLKGRLYLFS